MYRQNCTYTGSFRPIDCRTLATCSGVAWIPAMTRAGSPGSACTIATTTAITPRRVTTEVTSLRTRYAANPLTPRSSLYDIEAHRSLRVRSDRHELLVRLVGDAGQVRLVSEDQRLAPQEDPGSVLPDDLLDLAVLGVT